MNQLIAGTIRNVKSGEYDGGDLMRLWCYTESQALQIDESIKLLKECREFLASDAFIGPCGLGLICMIDERIEELEQL